MKSNFSACLSFTLQQEGGWADYSEDTPTMAGITLATYREFMGTPSLTVDNLRVITPETITAIYQQNYWTPIHGNDLPIGVDLMMFDGAVNMGVSRSVEMVQQNIGTTVDGDLGPLSLAAIRNISASSLIEHLYTTQVEFYQSLAKFSIFGNGWLNRTTARKTAAIAMIEGVVA